jgi:V-type H+-transporting ATPase subunit a
MIICKWLTNYTEQEHSAPSVITQMINMFLKGGELSGMPFFGSEEDFISLQAILVLISFICVPTMLFVKPFYFYKNANKTFEINLKKKDEENKTNTLGEENDEDAVVLIKKET